MIKVLVEVLINDYEEVSTLDDIEDIENIVEVDSEIPYSILTWDIKNITIE